MNRIFIPFFPALVVAAGFQLSLPASANVEWMGANGQFDQPGNWSTGEVPSPQDNVLFSSQGLDSVFWGSGLREVGNITSNRAGSFFVGSPEVSMAFQDIHVMSGQLYLMPTISGSGINWTVDQSAKVFVYGTHTDAGTIAKRGEGELAFHADANPLLLLLNGSVSLVNSVFTGNYVEIRGSQGNPSLMRVGNGAKLTHTWNDAEFIMDSNEGASAVLEIAGDGAPGLLDLLQLTATGEGVNTLRFDHTHPEYFLSHDGTASGHPVSIEAGADLHLSARRGTTILLADYDLAGTHTIAADGVLQLGNNTGAGSLTGPIINHGELIFNRSNAVTFNHPISGNGRVTFRGDGQFSIDGLLPNTYSGDTTVDGARLRVRDDVLLGSPGSRVSLQNGGALQNLNSFLVLDEDREVWLASGEGRLRAGWSREIDLRSPVAGPGDLRLVNDSGRIVLSNPDNSYDGLTFLGGDETNGGYAQAESARLVLGADHVLPNTTSLVFDPGADKTGILDLAGSSQQIAGLDVLSGTPVISNGEESWSTLTLTQPLDVVYDGEIGESILLRQHGGGVLTLRGSNPDTYKNAIETDHGTLILDGVQFGSTEEGRHFRTNVVLSETAEVRLKNGTALLSDQGQIAVAPASTGSVVVEGENTSWEMASNLTIGTADSTGSLIIRDGANVSAETEIELRGTLLLQDGGVLRSNSTHWMNSLKVAQSQEMGHSTIIIGGEDEPVLPGSLQVPFIEITGDSGLNLVFNHTSEDYRFEIDVESRANTSGTVEHRAGNTTLTRNIEIGNGSVFVSGGTLTVDGPLFTPTLVEGAGRIDGTGAIDGKTTVQNGGVIAPGKPIGGMILPNLEFGPGGVYEWNISDPDSTPRFGWSLLTGHTIHVTELSAGEIPFTISLRTVNAHGEPSPLPGFNPTQTYEWTIALYRGDFDPTRFADVLIDSQRFASASGAFSLNFTEGADPGSHHEISIRYTPHSGDYSTWVAENALTGSDADPMADPAGDGTPNLLKYAWRLPVMDTFPSAIHTVGTHEASGETYPKVHVLLPEGISIWSAEFGYQDLLYSVQASRDLTDWTTEPLDLIEARPSESHPGYVEAIFAALDHPMAESSSMFFRVKVSLSD